MTLAWYHSFRSKREICPYDLRSFGRALVFGKVVKLLNANASSNRGQLRSSTGKNSQENLRNVKKYQMVHALALFHTNN